MLSLQDPKILRLMFEMLKFVNEAQQPFEEHDLVQKALQRHKDFSFVDAAIALHELRSSCVLRNEGTYIVKHVSNEQEAPPFKTWPQPHTANLGDGVLRITVFVPDETVFASEEMLPWAWTTQFWKRKEDVNDYFKQLICDISSATEHNFMAVAHALQESLGSAPRGMLKLLNATEIVEPCKSDEICNIGNGEECSQLVLKCPSCKKFNICLVCLASMHSPERRDKGWATFSQQTEEPTTLPNFDYQKHITDEFNWLYCCKNPSCRALFPPSFWSHLTAEQNFAESQKTRLLEQMSRAVSRRVRYNEDPAQEPFVFACRSAACGCFLSSSSRDQMVCAF
jgi:hypothetical protein